MENKDYCEDLTEGKFSYPIIHAILSNPEDRRLIRNIFYLFLSKFKILTFFSCYKKIF